MPRLALLFAVAIAASPLASAGAQVRLPTTPPIRQLTPPDIPLQGIQQIPPSYRPPPGMCRIWLDGVAPAQQPAPTDCPTAVRNRPSNGRVIFGDDYVDKKDRKKDKRPEGHSDATVAAVGATLALGPGPSSLGPQPDEPLIDDARHALVPGVVAFEASAEQPPVRRDSVRARVRRDSTLSERRRALRESRRDERGDERRDERRDDRDDDRGDDPDDRRDARGPDGVARGYYPPYAPPARANGVCLDRDGDGWCDDVRGGSQYCLDRDGDGRCDDYPELASAPYSSSMPPMRAALDVRNGMGSPIALRWLGTAEVLVRTSELRRTGVPYRAMWLDAGTNRLLQVWTDRDGDGVADRIEIYRNGRVAKIIGR